VATNNKLSVSNLGPLYKASFIPTEMKPLLQTIFLVGAWVDICPTKLSDREILSYFLGMGSYLPHKM
jgi:hypothetical protein